MSNEIQKKSNVASIDIADINAQVAIAFGLAIIAFLLVYIAFFK